MSGSQRKPTGQRRLSRTTAFAAQGVLLEYPSHSWSGVRGGDGVVVVAIRASSIRVDDDGCSCLLWSPAIRAEAWLERASHQERLEHCRLAMGQHAADGLLAYGEDATFDAGEVIGLSVAKIGEEYWAKWGSAVRALVGRVGAFRMNHYMVGVA